MKLLLIGTLLQISGVFNQEHSASGFFCNYCSRVCPQIITRCSSGFEKIGNGCFFFPSRTSRVTYAGALKQCKQRGARLFEPTRKDMATYNLVKQALGKKGYLFNTAYLGINDIKKEDILFMKVQDCQWILLIGAAENQTTMVATRTVSKYGVPIGLITNVLQHT